jgi:hypothetical protein
MGGAVAQVVSLAALNPAMLAVGAAVGFIAAQFSSVAEAAKAAEESIGKAMEGVRKYKAERDKQATEYLGSAENIKRLRSRAMDRPKAEDYASASAVAAGEEFMLTPEEQAAGEQRIRDVRRATPRAKSPEEILAEPGYELFGPRSARKPTSQDNIREAAGFGDMDPAEFEAGRFQLQYDPEFQKTKARVESIKTREAMRADDIRVQSMGGRTATDRRVAELETEIAQMKQYINSLSGTGYLTSSVNALNIGGGNIVRDKQAESTRRMETIQAELEYWRAQAGSAGR